MLFLLRDLILSSEFNSYSLLTRYLMIMLYCQWNVSGIALMSYCGVMSPCLQDRFLCINYKPSCPIKYTTSLNFFSCILLHMCIIHSLFQPLLISLLPRPIYLPLYLSFFINMSNYFTLHPPYPLTDLLTIKFISS